MSIKDRGVSLVSQESGYGSDEDIDFLMPNGIVVPMKCERRTSIGSIKTELWIKARELPGAHLLRDSKNYVFIGVTKDSIEQEFDDTMTFKDLDLVWPQLEVSLPKRDRDINRLYRIASEVCGIQIRTLDSESDTNHELREHRILLKRLGRVSAAERAKWSEEKKLLFFFPPILDINPDLPYCTEKLIMKAHNLIQITAWLYEEKEQYSYDVVIRTTDPPMKAIKEILKKRLEERYQNEYEIDRRVSAQYGSYVLKVCGKEEYMLKECCMHAYMYFRNCINNEEKPQLQIVEKKELLRNLPENACVILQQEEELYEPWKPPDDVICTWDLPHSMNYSIRINSLPARRYENTKLEESVVVNVNPVRATGHVRDFFDQAFKNHHLVLVVSTKNLNKRIYRDIHYYVEAQLFHGRQTLSKPVRTLNRGFKQLIEFGVSIQSLPRCARLCFVVCSIERNGQFANAKVLGRLNVNVFDNNGVLVTGKFSKGVWETRGIDYNNRYSPGLVDGNPDKSALSLQYDVFSPGEQKVTYPRDSEIDRKLVKEERHASITSKPEKFETLDKIAGYHPLQNLTEAEKKILWNYREFALEYNPNLLPWLYHCVKWLDRHQVFEFYRLLKVLEYGEEKTAEREAKQGTLTKTVTMKHILLKTAIQLLGPDYIDTRTRTFAVHCIELHKTREQLRLYLPQLVQAYRFDNYMKNELGNFLLYHALKDKTLGYKFFWALRCEMSRSQSKHRFAPLLEAYCLFCGADILENRENEVKAMKKYQEVSRKIKQEQNDNNHNTILQNWLHDEETKEVLENKAASMDECIQLGQLCIDDCKLLTSKMRPLWLTWKNRSEVPDEVGSDTVKYIVKCGDDLRQDMLVSQLLNLMDTLWKYSENDYKLTVYNCLAMEQDIGVIEVVRDAVTVCDIEMKKDIGVLRGTVSSTHIHEWLTDINYEEKKDYLKMVRIFTMSCAGYCVATYLLGVGDRHSDNIMISKIGKLFHIDFGHFMNHKKVKAGVNRERNPFVLTNEFVRVVNRGGSTIDSTLFRDFTYKCFEAFMVIRRNANIFITLLQMMMYCELSELSENKDIEYFINALQLGKPEHVAAEHFLKELFKSLKGQWTVKLDWMFHKLNRIMKVKDSS